jgi:hypothetical protein
VTRDDLWVAKERLNSRGLNLVVVRQGLVVAESSEPGLEATLQCLEEVRCLGPGASMADRIVGRAAAWAAVWAGIEACYGALMSLPAEEILRAHGIRLEAHHLVEEIRDRLGLGRCPMEEAVAQAKGAEEALEALRQVIETWAR